MREPKLEITDVISTIRPGCHLIHTYIHLCFFHPRRGSFQNLQGAGHLVWTTEPDHHCPSDSHLGVHRHREPKAHCFLEQAWYQLEILHKFIR